MQSALQHSLQREGVSSYKGLLSLGLNPMFELFLFILRSGMTNSIINKYLNNSLVFSQWGKLERLQAGFSEKTPQCFWMCGHWNERLIGGLSELRSFRLSPHFLNSL